MLTIFAALVAAPELKLVDFLSGDQTVSVMNDPVMGGQSHSTFAATSGVGKFEGKCAIVPFLKAPGFCKVSSTHPLLQPAHFADASRYISGALYIEARSTSPAYKGFKVEMLAKNVTRPRSGGMHHSAPSFKADVRFRPDRKSSLSRSLSSRH